MDNRTALLDNSCLKLGAFMFTIGHEIGRGSTCIVYEASYLTSTDDKKLVRIKECYPFNGGVERSETGELHTKNVELFERSKAKMIEDFRLENNLFYSSGLTDSLANTFDIYRANNTVYIVTAYLKDSALSEYEPSSLKSCVSIVRQTACAVGKLHQEGFLYLDTKPDNILVVENSERVILFDFDSLLPISSTQRGGQNVRLSYSRGFAAPEQQLGKLRQIGFRTDVYGIGALLFYLVFGRTPNTFDRESGAEYDFSKTCYPAQYRDRLYFALRMFFRRTLANYRFDRYPNMDETVVALAELERLADVTKPYIISSRINRPAFFVGREQELEMLNGQLQSADKYFFVSGMGGIGKTTLIREFIARCRDKLDGVLWLNYNGSLRQLICDDAAVCVNTVSRFDEESEEDYFPRKCKALKSAAENECILAVVDDFDNEKEIHIISGIFHKVIFITRNDVRALNCGYISVTSITNKAALQALFEHNSRTCLPPSETRFFDEITEKISAHTLVLELIAKQISCSFLSVEQAAEIVCSRGFTDIAPEKIEHFRDGVYYFGTVKRIISELMAINRLSDMQIALLKITALFGVDGIEARLLQRLCELPTLDDVNTLIRRGWINRDNGTVFLHTVVSEIIGVTSFSCEDKILSERMMNNLAVELSHADRECSRKLYDLTEKLLFGYVVPHGKSYARLSFSALMHCPIDREEGVLERAEMLIKTPEYFTVRELMDVYAIILDMCEAKCDYVGAESALEQAKAFAESVRDDFALAQYYDLAADFLNKRYDQGDVKKCLKYCRKAMGYAHRIDDDMAQQLLASSALFKAVVMMRNGIGSRREVLSLLRIGEENCQKSTEPMSQIIYELHMTKARFCVKYEHDKIVLQACLRDAYKVVELLYPYDLGTVIHIILPAARMYYDLLDKEHAVWLLQKGAELCERHIELAPYARQLEEIKEIIRDITGA